MKKTQTTKYYIAAFVAVAAFAVYLPSLQNEFILWDDNLYVYENLHIRSLDSAFFRWAFFDFHAGNWHPLTWISHALDYVVWGLNPLGHHLTNNILHAVNTFVVVLLVVRLLEAARELTNNKISPNPSRDHNSPFTPPVIITPPLPPLILRGGEAETGGVIPRGGGEAGGVIPKRGTSAPPPLEKGDRGGFSDKKMFITAATTGLLFGLHPLHVESVAWVSERKDLLCALFFMLSVMMYLRYVTPPILPLDKGRGESEVVAGLSLPYGSQRWYTFSLLFFILALLSKPMAVTLPVVLLIVDWYPLGRIQSFKSVRTAIVGKLPFIALSIISSVVTVFAQRSGESIRSIEFAPFLTRILVAAKSLIIYIWKMIMPLNLSPFYPYPQEASLLSVEYLSAIVLVSGITIACVVMAKRQKLWLSAWGYYVMTLLPVLGIVQVGTQSMADRYTYLPGLGPFFLLGLMTAWVWARLNGLENRGMIAKVLSAAVSASLIVSLSYLTFRQTGIWRDSIALWSYVIEREPESTPFVYYNRAIAFEKTGQINRAIADYDKAIALYPFYHAAYNNRGMAYKKIGQIEKAIADFDKAIALNPDQYIVYNNRAKAFEQVGLFDKAIADFDMAIALNPSHYEAYNNLGVLYGNAAQYDKAIENFTKAIFLNPGHSGAYVNRGVLYANTANKELAVSDFQKACELRNRAGCSALDALMKEETR